MKFEIDKIELMFLIRRNKNNYRGKVVKIQGKEF